MRASLVWFCCLLFTGHPGWSQNRSGQNDSRARADVFAGYSYTSPDFGEYNNSGGENGLDAGADIRFRHWLAIAVDGGYLHKSYNPEESSSTGLILAGPRVFVPISSDEAISPFVDFLAGVSTFSWSGTGLSSIFTNTASATFGGDGGLDYRLTRHAAARVQGGFLHSDFNSTYSILQSGVHNNHGRVVVALVWRF